MASAVNIGSINLPKMMRQISHRTSQVRDLTFIRDAILDKEVATHRKSGTTTALSGPAVNFGYEGSSNTALDGTADNTAYHTITPEIVLPGLTMLQSPIVSRSGQLERGGHRITGACTFYAPSLDYIKALPNFKDTVAFSELESYDKLLDMERIIQKPIATSGTVTWPAGNYHNVFDLSPDSTYPTGYEIDRIQFKIKSANNLSTITLTGVDSTSKTIVWTATDTFTPTDWVTVDLPLRDITTGDTKEVYIGGAGKTFTATSGLDVDKLIGGVSTSYLSNLIIDMSGSASVELRDIYLYKEAEWRVESIKDYRDEYMQIATVRVRGDRASRRRTYG